MAILRYTHGPHASPVHTALTFQAAFYSSLHSLKSFSVFTTDARAD